MPRDQWDIVDRLARRALALAVKMIDEANNRPDEEEGDPKVGGHPSAVASCTHILSTLRFRVAGPQDTFAVKPHASPMDHAVNFLLGLFREPGGRRWLSLEESQEAMKRLRQFPFHGEPVFQSYHAESDPDSWGYFPSGSVGIPPAVSLFTALAYRYAADHRFEVPKDVHHWSVLGDSEMREGSVSEAMPEAAERELPNITWIVDYNRQSLDGTRVPNDRALHGTDYERLERIARANGWDAIQVMHGRQRLAAFERKGGALLKDVLEHDLTDFELQSLLLKRDGKTTRERLVSKDAKLGDFLNGWSDAELQALLEDLGGHDVRELGRAFEQAKGAKAPTLIVAHTVKGWGLKMWAQSGNHSALPDEKEVESLLEGAGIDRATKTPYQRFPEASEEGRYLGERGAAWRRGIEEQWALKDRNSKRFSEGVQQSGALPPSLGIDLKMTPIAHTQYVWGQAIGRLIRVATTAAGGKLAEAEERWVPVAEMLLTLAPDVGTSTNINPAMDDKIYGPPPEEDYEETLGVRDRRRPALAPKLGESTRHMRFEICEANAMSAAGAFGKLGYSLGIPFRPAMTVYDFFIKRALDQLYYNLYWGSTFTLVGTPGGVTLSPEGAQHSWKSDIQMPNLVTWEPMYGVEVDWIVAETLRRHAAFDDRARTGVLLRCVTRGLQQKEMLTRLRRHRRFKQNPTAALKPAELELDDATSEAELEPRSDAEILEAVRRDVVAGGYYLVDWRGYAGYEPGDNVVQLVAMGSVGTEALAASDALLEQGIYANVIVCTSPDLLLGNLAHENGYRHLKETLGVTGALYFTRRRTNGHTRYEVQTKGDLVEAAGARVPVVSVADGEVGLLDNLGSIVGTRHEALGLRKASKSGRPSDVYKLQHLDRDSIVQAALQVLGESALEEVVVSRSLLELVAQEPPSPPPPDWRKAWGAEALE